MHCEKRGSQRVISTLFFIVGSEKKGKRKKGESSKRLQRALSRCSSRGALCKDPVATVLMASRRWLCEEDEARRISGEKGRRFRPTRQHRRSDVRRSRRPELTSTTIAPSTRSVFPPMPPLRRSRPLSAIERKSKFSPRVGGFFSEFFSLDLIFFPPLSFSPSLRYYYRHHPDVGGAAGRFLRIAEAYALLTGRGGRKRSSSSSSSSYSSHHHSSSSSSSSSSSWSFHDFFWSFSAKRRSSWAARKARERAGGVFESFDEDFEEGQGGEGRENGASSHSSSPPTPPPPAAGGPAPRAALNQQLAGLRLRAERRRAAGGGSASAARAAAGKPRRGRSEGGEEGDKARVSTSSVSPSPHLRPSSPPEFYYVSEGSSPGDSATCEEAWKEEEEGEEEEEESEEKANGNNDDSHHQQQQQQHHRRPTSSSFVGDAESRRRQLAGLRRKSAIRRATAATRGGGEGGQGVGGGKQQQD